MTQSIKTQLIQTITHELEQQTIIELYDKLYAYLQNNMRYHNENFRNIKIRKNALPQGEYFAIQQAIDEVFCNNEHYCLTPTLPKGAYYPKIELANLIIIPRRSVSRKDWQKANYLKELAKYNQSLKAQLDLFQQLESSDKILLIMDILYDIDRLYIKYILPSSNLRDILITVSYTEIVEEYEQPIQPKSVNPTAKLKKTLKDIDKKAG